MPSFQRATREQRKLRMALFGPSGSGKTFTALKIGRELVGPDGTIAVIDTERSSASIYADFEFDTVPLTKYTHSDYTSLIAEAAKAGYDMLVIDSLSHAWEGDGGVLDLVEQVTQKQSGKKDSFRAWGDDNVKAAQRNLWNAVLSYPGHVIVTMRAKTVYERSTNERGKATIEKLGLAPIQRSGVEFELDILGEMDLTNTMTITKARDPEGKLEGSRVTKPGVEFAAGLRDWLNKGSTPSEDHEAKIKVMAEKLAKELEIDYEMFRGEVWTWITGRYGCASLAELTLDQLDEIPEEMCIRFGKDDIESDRQLRETQKETPAA